MSGLPRVITVDDLWLTAQDFRNSFEGRSIKNLGDYTDDDINLMLLSVQQSIVTQGIDLNVHTIFNESQRVNLLTSRDIVVKVYNKPLLSISTLILYYNNIFMFQINLNNVVIYPELGEFRIAIPWILSNSPITTVFAYPDLLYKLNEFDVRVTYQTGYDTIPPDVVKALRMLTLDYFYQMAQARGLINLAPSGTSGNSTTFQTSPAGQLLSFKTGDYEEKYNPPKLTFMQPNLYWDKMAGREVAASALYLMAWDILLNYKSFPLA